MKRPLQKLSEGASEEFFCILGEAEIKGKRKGTPKTGDTGLSPGLYERRRTGDFQIIFAKSHQRVRRIFNKLSEDDIFR